MAIKGSRGVRPFRIHATLDGDTKVATFSASGPKDALARAVNAMLRDEPEDDSPATITFRIDAIPC